MADPNTKTCGSFHSLGHILTTLVGDVRTPDFNALQEVRTDPFRGPHLGRISDYQTMKAHIANGNPTPAAYERAIHDYVRGHEI